MLSFTFSIASDRHASRRELVRDEAVAIRTSWLRSDFLPDPDRAEAAALLREYVDGRVTFARAVSSDTKLVSDALTQADRIQDRLWEMAVVNARKDMNSDVAALYIDALNKVISLHSTRVALGIQARIHREIWLVLFCITVLGMVAIGYQTAIAESKRSITWPILAVSFALVFALIASLDRYDSGVMTVSQQPLMDLRDDMTKTERGQ